MRMSSVAVAFVVIGVGCTPRTDTPSGAADATTQTLLATAAPSRTETASKPTLIDGAPTTRPNEESPCAGLHGLEVATAFVAAINSDDPTTYTRCIYPSDTTAPLNLISLPSYVAMIQQRGFELTGGRRGSNVYSFASADPAAATAGPADLDVGLPLDVTVSKQPDGLYYVTDAFVEYHD